MSETYFDKVADLKATTLLKRESGNEVFMRFLRTAFCITTPNGYFSDYFC